MNPSAKELEEKHGVSIRTARRWRQRDRISAESMTNFYGEPMKARTTGKDGKSYPAYRNRYNVGEHGYTSTLIMAAFRQARYGLRKADKLACESGIEPRDVAALDALLAQAQEVAARWHTVDQAQADG